MDTWGEDLAIFTPKSMHEAKMLPGRGLIARIRGKGTHTARFLPAGPRAAAVQGRDARLYGAARRVTALGRATQRVAASAERARRAAGLAGAAVVGAAVQGRRWWARRCGCCMRGGRGAAGGCGDGDSTGTHGATGAMEAGDGWPRGVGARSAQYASSSGGYSPKPASITATRSSSASMSCRFTSSIFCKSAGEAFST